MLVFTWKINLKMSEYFRKIPYKQDLPPPGGYASYVYKSQVKSRGPAGVAIMAGGLAVMAVGFYFVAKGNQNRRSVSIRFYKGVVKTLLPYKERELWNKKLVR